MIKKMRGAKFLACVVATTLAVTPLTGIGSVQAAGKDKHVLDAQMIGHVENQNGRTVFVYDDSTDLAPRTGRLRSAETLPQKYDLREQGQVTPVKNQGSYGSCWTFGAMASSESNAIKKGNADTQLDLSEMQLLYFHAHGANADTDKSTYAGGDSFVHADWTEGGNRYFATPTLTRWYGEAAESSVPYGVTPSLAKQTVSDLHVQEVHYLPEALTLDASGVWQSGTTVNMAAIQEIKKAIYNTGAVSTGYYSDAGQQNSRTSDFWRQDTSSYFYDGSPINGQIVPGNHEITLVGYDDTYSRTNFSKTPEGDGAWIVKNSWGTGSGDGGYFYLSYYDKSMSQATSYIVEDAQFDGAETNHTYDNIYQYDGVGMGECALASSSELLFANIFQAREDEKLEAVGTYALAANAVLDIHVYKNPTQADEPESGEEVAAVTKNTTYAGYYTIPLGSQAVDMKKGDTFVITASAKVSGNYYTLVELTYADGVPAVTIDSEQGQSLMKLNGSWFDSDTTLRVGETDYKMGNAMIKAYTDQAEKPDLKKITLTYFDSQSKKTGTKTYTASELSVDTHVAVAVPKATAKVQVSEIEVNGANNTYTIMSGGVQQSESTDIIRNLCEGESGITVSTQIGEVVQNYYFDLTFESTVLTADNKNVTVTDNSSLIPKDIAFGADKVQSGTEYDAIKEKFSSMGLHKFTLWKLSAAYADAAWNLPSGTAVNLMMKLPAGYTESEAGLFALTYSDGQVTVSNIASCNNQSFGADITALNGYYAVAEAATGGNIPDVPVLTNKVTYNPTQTLADISLPTVQGGTWAWDLPSTVPTVNVTAYPATFTPSAGSGYQAYQADISLTVEKAVPVIEQAAGSGIVYGQKLIASIVSGKASLNGTNVAGGFEWKNSAALPDVKNTGFAVTFQPTDTINYSSVDGTADVTVAPREVKAIADSISVSYGKEIPAFTYQVQNLVTGGTGKDDITADFSCDAVKGSEAGNYEIEFQSGHSTSGNYVVLAGDAGVLTITPNRLGKEHIKNESELPDELVEQIEVSGSFIVNADSKIVVKDIDPESDMYQQMEEKLKAGESIKFICDIEVQQVSSAKGAYYVTLPSDEAYNRKAVRVLHFVSANKLDKDNQIATEDKVDEYNNVVVKNGAVEIETYSCSPFAVVYPKSDISGEGKNPSRAEKTNKTSLKNGVKTGDLAQPGVYAAGVLLAGLVIVWILRKKIKQS